MPCSAAAENQQHHVRRDRRRSRAGDEQADGEQDHRAAAADVGQLAVKRRHRGRGQQIGGDDPRQVLEIAEVRPMVGKRGGDDGLVERGEERRQHQPEEDGADFGVAHRARGGCAAGDWRGHRRWRWHLAADLQCGLPPGRARRSRLGAALGAPGAGSRAAERFMRAIDPGAPQQRAIRGLMLQSSIASRGGGISMSANAGQL